MAEMQPPNPPTPPMQPHRGVMVLIFGILGVLGIGVYGLGIIFAILAWVFGAKDLKAMNQGRMDQSGRGLTQAGWILGIIGAVLWVLAMLLAVVGLFFWSARPVPMLH